MAEYPATGSNLTNGTNVSLSTFVLIKVNGNPVGAVKSLQVNEGRNITQISEIGTDGILDSAPSKAATVEGSCQRTRFDRMRVTEAFDRGYLHVKSQRYPFDIEVIDRITGEGAASYIKTIIKSVWIKSLSYTYDSDSYIIVDNMGWIAEDIATTVNGGSAALGGKRNRLIPKDPIEVAADIGRRRGGVDLPDLYELPSSLRP